MYSEETATHCETQTLVTTFYKSLHMYTYTYVCSFVACIHIHMSTYTCIYMYVKMCRHIKIWILSFQVPKMQRTWLQSTWTHWATLGVDQRSLSCVLTSTIAESWKQFAWWCCDVDQVQVMWFWSCVVFVFTHMLVVCDCGATWQQNVRNLASQASCITGVVQYTASYSVKPNG